ncbi:Phenylacetic acid catabolic protein [Natrialbaceae archaeon A-gly3]
MTEWSSEAVDYVQAIADTKLMIGHRFAQWSLAGPTLEDNIGGTSSTQEEIGHVRQLFDALEEQGRDREWLEGERDPEEFANVSSLDTTGEDWQSFIAAVGPADRAAWYLLDAIALDDLEGLLTAIGEDEFFHLEYYDARLQTLAEEEPEKLQAALEETLPASLAFIGPAEHDEESDPLVDAGFTDRSAAEIREAFRDHYETLFEGTDVSLENVDWSAPDTEAWDEARRRVTDGGPTDQDVSQLRGEKNAAFAAN